MITVKEQPRNLFASIATYSEISRSASLRFLRNAFERLLQPSIADSDIQIRLSGRQLDSGRKYSSPVFSGVDSVDWQRLGDPFPLAWLALNAWKEGNLSLGKNPSVAGVTVHFQQNPQQANTLEFSASIEICWWADR